MKDESSTRSDGELLEDVDYILAKLDQRVLTTDGGKADPMVHHWNLTEGDSAMHREAAAHIRALVEKLAAVRSEQQQTSEPKAWVDVSCEEGYATTDKFKAECYSRNCYPLTPLYERPDSTKEPK